VRANTDAAAQARNLTGKMVMVVEGRIGRKERKNARFESKQMVRPVIVRQMESDVGGKNEEETFDVWICMAGRAIVCNFDL
jgi:hypothetical protein